MPNKLFENVLTLISKPGKLTREHINAVSYLSNNTKGSWLGNGEAWETYSFKQKEEIETIVRDKLKGESIDVIVQQNINRKKRLLISDMDSTIIGQESLDVVAEHAGVGQEVSKITNNAMIGKIDFSSSLKKRVKFLSGKPASLFQKVYKDKIFLNTGAKILIDTMRANNAVTILVSGGFNFFCDKIADEVGFDYAYSNNLEIINGIISGNIIKPIYDSVSKLNSLQMHCSQHGITMKDTIAVGDGANDILMLKNAGMGISFHGKSITKQYSDAELNYCDLTGILYIQGYKQSEFINNQT